jgi:hypothetical protein
MLSLLEARNASRSLSRTDGTAILCNVELILRCSVRARSQIDFHTELDDPRVEAAQDFSDESGDYELHVKAQDGVSPAKAISLGTPPSFFYKPT